MHWMRNSSSFGYSMVDSTGPLDNGGIRRQSRGGEGRPNEGQLLLLSASVGPAAQIRVRQGSFR
jgi:hypothetical protein